MKVYLDNAATTKVDEDVVEAMQPFFTEKYGNPSSIHSLGEESRQAIEEVREIIAKSIDASPSEIIFTSGGTEANNLALKGVTNKGDHIITTKIEHDSVIKTCKWLESQGIKVTYLSVDEEGFIDLNELEKAIISETKLVSIIHGNNEIGTIQDLENIGKICKKHNILFHTDACQSYTKVELNVKKYNLDLVTLNAHKIHGPKGVGALFIKKGTKITSLAHGGGHEFGIRSGTENTPAIVGFAKAVELGIKEDVKQMIALRDYFIDELLKIPDAKLNGSRENRLCNNINISFKYIEGESIGSFLDSEGISTSTGSACSSRSLEPSHVMMALENNPERAHGSIRLTISKYTTKEEIDFTLKEIKKTVEKLRKTSPLGGVVKRVL